MKKQGKFIPGDLVTFIKSGAHGTIQSKWFDGNEMRYIVLVQNRQEDSNGLWTVAESSLIKRISKEKSK